MKILYKEQNAYPYDNQVLNLPEIKLLLVQRLNVLCWQGGNFQAPYWRLYRNTSSNASIQHESQTIPIEANRIYLIAPETPFAANSNGEIDHLFIHFLISSPFDHIQNGIWHFPESESNKTAIDIITSGLTKKEIKPQLTLAASSLCCSTLMQIPASEIPSHTIDYRIAKAMKFIRKNYAHKISNEMLAEKAALNTNSFIRLFRNNTGMPPQRFLQEERLKQACLLLQYSTSTIEEIAEKTGFCDRFYFSKIFSKYRKTSPAEFRKMAL